MKRLAAALLALLILGANAGYALEGAFLSGEQLRALEPAYEAFLNELADTLVKNDLLPEGDREAWILYQIGDFLQNGGFGSIAVLYTPGLLSVADESVTARRMSVETDAGTLHLETLHRYAEHASPLPGLPLDVELFDENGEVVPCRFRWVASGGSLLIWDGALESVVNVGATYINDDKPLYWYEEPVEGVDETLTIELLHPTQDELLGRAQLVVLSGGDFWAPEGLN